jgi:hypothetical protein
MTPKRHRGLQVDVGSGGRRVLGEGIGHDMGGSEGTAAGQRAGRAVVVAGLAEGMTCQGAVLEWDRHGTG